MHLRYPFMLFMFAGFAGFAGFPERSGCRIYG